MQTLEWMGLVTALEPLAHNGGQILGTTSMVRRQAVVVDGRREEIPVISGNSLRGKLRRIGMRHFCRALGYGVDTETGEVRGLSREAYYFLFSGGSLTKDSAKALDLAAEDDLRRLIPLVSLLGGTNGSRPMHGKLQVGALIPVCRETAALLPAPYVEEAQRLSYTALLDEHMHTRRDDLHEAQYVHRLVAAPSSVLGLLADARPTREPSTPTQMLYHTETLAAGATFAWRITLVDVTDVERDAWLTTMAEWARLPTVGAKAAVGFGRVRVQFDHWLTIDSHITAGREVAVQAGQAYHEHLQQHGDAIRDMLARVA